MFIFFQRNQTGIERLQILVKEQDNREVIWNLPFWKHTDERLWIEGQVLVRVPDNPDFEYQACINFIPI